MGVQNATIKAGATSLSVTGGTDMTYTPDGTVVEGGIHIANAAQSDFRIRENITLKNKQPALQPDGSYSKAKRSVVAVFPMLTASGKTVFNLFRGELEVHPEASVAVASNIQLQGAQIMSDPDFASFWSTGSLA